LHAVAAGLIFAFALGPSCCSGQVDCLSRQETVSQHRPSFVIGNGGTDFIEFRVAE
jgi:hypothetical protein